MGLSDEHEEEEEVEEEDEEEVEEQGETRPASGDSAGVTMTRGGFGGCWCARAAEAAAAPLGPRGGCRHDARWLGSRRIFSSFIFSDVRRWISVLRRTFMSSTDSDSWGEEGEGGG